MRIEALVPALILGAALVAPPLAEADHHRSRDRGGRSGYDRSARGHAGYERGRSHRFVRRGHSGRYDRGQRRHHYRPHRRPYYPPRRPAYRRPYYGPRYGPRYGPYHGFRPYPRAYYAPYPAPYAYPSPGYGGPPRYRGGVHGSVSIGLPFFGFSLHF